MTAICEHLKISRPTYYRYISPPVAAIAPTPKTAKVRLWLGVANNNKFIRKKKK